MVVDRHVRLVFKRRDPATRDVAAHDNRTSREVPGSTKVSGRSVDKNATGKIRILGCVATTAEDLAAEVNVALGIPRDGWVASRAPVLPSERCSRQASGELHRNLRVGPVPSLVHAVAGDTVTVAAQIVVARPDDVVRIQRVLGNGCLVVRLRSPGQVRVSEVEAALVDLDVGAKIHRTSSGIRSREVGVWRPRRALTARIQLKVCKSGQDPLLDGV